VLVIAGRIACTAAILGAATSKSSIFLAVAEKIGIVPMPTFWASLRFLMDSNQGSADRKLDPYVATGKLSKIGNSGAHLTGEVSGSEIGKVVINEGGELL